MSFNPNTYRSAGSAGGYSSGPATPQARGVSGAGTNAGSFKAHAASESNPSMLSQPVPGYSGPRHPKGSPLGGDPDWDAYDEGRARAAFAGLGAPAAASPLSQPVPGYTGPRHPKGAEQGGDPDWDAYDEGRATATFAGLAAPASPLSQPVPGYVGPRHPAGSPMGGDPSWMPASGAPRESAPALSAGDKALLDADMQNIESDPGLNEVGKASYRSMADALESHGAGYVNAGMGPRVTFAAGSFYGGRPVPEQFARFHAKVDGEGRAQSAASAERIRLSREADRSPQVPAVAEAPKKSVMSRLFGR